MQLDKRIPMKFSSTTIQQAKLDFNFPFKKQNKHPEDAQQASHTSSHIHCSCSQNSTFNIPDTTYHHTINYHMWGILSLNQNIKYKILRHENFSKIVKGENRSKRSLTMTSVSQTSVYLGLAFRTTTTPTTTACSSSMATMTAMKIHQILT